MNDKKKKLNLQSYSVVCLVCLGSFTFSFLESVSLQPSALFALLWCCLSTQILYL